MRQATFVHPHLIDELLASDFFPHLATIQTNTPTRGTAGGLKPAWATVPGLEAVPAAKGVVGGTEQRGPELVTEESRIVVQLAGYFPEITASMRCLLNDGSVLDIVAANADALNVMSQLTCRTVTPVASPGQ